MQAVLEFGFVMLAVMSEDLGGVFFMMGLSLLPRLKGKFGFMGSFVSFSSVRLM